MSVKPRPLLALVPLCLASAGQAQEPPAPQPQLLVARPAPPPEHPAAIVVPKDTMVRLMVVNEVNTRKAKPGDKFVLRVDEAVALDGKTVIPVGAKAWGEVTRVKENGAVGKAGVIGARLLHIEVGDDKVLLEGEDKSRGDDGGSRVALAAVAFGIFGLLAEGAQGKLKAGHIFNGSLAEDRLFDPEAGKLIPAAAKAE